VHAIGQPDFRDRDNAAAANVAAAAAAAGVRRIVYLGGFRSDDGTLSEHLAGRAEVADALSVDRGPELVWLGAAVIIGAGSTSFEMVRLCRRPVLAHPDAPWADHGWTRSRCATCCIYLLAAADSERVAAGATTSSADHHHVSATCCAAMSARRASCGPGFPVYDVVPKSLVGRLGGAAVPVPSGLASDLIQSLDHP